jgi:GAF domain-containing protein
MRSLPLSDDDRRVEALQPYENFDTPAEAEFDRLTGLAARCCRAPIAFICFVGRNRQWFKSIRGLDLADPNPHLAFCYHSILSRDLLIVPDARQDRRFAPLPRVASEPYLRFYAAAPLITPAGQPIGCLAVMDRVPRELEAEAAKELQALAAQVVALLELRRLSVERARPSAAASSGNDGFGGGAALRAEPRHAAPRRAGGGVDCGRERRSVPVYRRLPRSGAPPAAFLLTWQRSSDRG